MPEKLYRQVVTLPGDDRMIEKRTRRTWSPCFRGTGRRFGGL